MNPESASHLCAQGRGYGEGGWQCSSLHSCSSLEGHCTGDALLYPIFRGPWEVGDGVRCREETDTAGLGKARGFRLGPVNQRLSLPSLHLTLFLGLSSIGNQPLQCGKRTSWSALSLREPFVVSSIICQCTRVHRKLATGPITSESYPLLTGVFAGQAQNPWAFVLIF